MIPVRSVYYMLSYAFQALHEQGYKDMAMEPFHNVAELCAAILVRGVAVQLKRGLGRAYLERTEPLTTLRGRIEVSESIKTKSIFRKQLVCAYDDFSVDTPMNRILKTTMLLLLRANISKAHKKELRKTLVFFGEIGTVEPHAINWRMRYHRNNQTYRMLMGICSMVIEGLLQTNADGTVRLMDFLDEQRMCRLYEKFILAYYRREHPALTASASQIAWQLDDEESAMLSVMQTDVTLRQGATVLITDAKYYEHALQQRYDTQTIHSANLYQIFTYVKNQEATMREQPHSVSGMLLYAKTDEEAFPDHAYWMSGNRIAVRTLDLSGDFEQIRNTLDGFVTTYFHGTP